MKTAMLYERLADNKVRCNVCAHRCVIFDGRRGICGVRENRGGELFSLVYGRVISEAIDPIEKKPFFHFYPGSASFSFATVGCNFHCRWCQNWSISQVVRDEGRIEGYARSPEDLVRLAQAYGCRSIAYTYTEPTIFFDFAYDTAKLAHAAGIANVFVTNGYLTPEAIETIQPYLDAANVDLKGFSERLYRKWCGARLQPVLDALKLMKRAGIWVEVTTLIVPGLNDSDAELRDAAEFIAKELGVETPWHLSRFYPAYQVLDRPPTPVALLKKAREIGYAAGLRYVYEGNVPGSEGETTLCWSCHRAVIRRYGFRIVAYRLRNGRCPDCGAMVDGIGL